MENFDSSLSFFVDPEPDKIWPMLQMRSIYRRRWNYKNLAGKFRWVFDVWELGEIVVWSKGAWRNCITRLSRGFFLLLQSILLEFTAWHCGLFHVCYFLLCHPTIFHWIKPRSCDFCWLTGNEGPLAVRTKLSFFGVVRRSAAEQQIQQKKYDW